MGENLDNPAYSAEIVKAQEQYQKTQQYCLVVMHDQFHTDGRTVTTQSLRDIPDLQSVCSAHTNLGL